MASCIELFNYFETSRAKSGRRWHCFKSFLPNYYQVGTSALTFSPGFSEKAFRAEFEFLK